MANSSPCFHCGLPSVGSIQSRINGVDASFCCIGCQAVAEAIVDGGLGRFYRHRNELSSTPKVSSVDFSAFDLERVQSQFVEPLSNGDMNARLYLGGINCAACVWLIEKHLEILDGVVSLQVNASSHRASIVFNPSSIKLSRILIALSDIGFQPQPLVGQVEQDQWQKRQRSQLLRLGVAGFGMMQAGMIAIALYAGDMQGIDPHWKAVLRWVSLLITTPIITYCAQPFFSAAISALKARHLVMDVSVSIALLLAYFSSVVATVSQSGHVYFDSVSMLIFFLLLGRYFESRARYLNFKSRAQFSRILPFTVDILGGKQSAVVEKTIPITDLQKGQCVLVSSGSVFPCDGFVIDGESEADESLLNGEAIPQAKVKGDYVFAGTCNGASPLSVRVDAVGAATEFSKIEDLVETASSSRPYQIGLVDAIAAKFVAVTLIVSILVASYWLWVEPSRALWVTLSVLVVTCPCALSLATPAALAAAVNRLRVHGVLITGAKALETLNEVDCVVFDKTGTLTNGDLKVAEVCCLSATTENDTLKICAGLEFGSSHPIAKAFTGYERCFVLSQKTELGRGVSGVVDGVCYRLGTLAFAMTGSEHSLAYPSKGLWLLLSGDGVALAWVRLEDQLRDTAYQAVQAFSRQGMKTVLLSGDRLENTESVAKLLSISDWRGDMLPKDKLTYLQNLQDKGHKVLMVGDGINDLPVLGGADVSCAMGTATRLAQTKADCILLGQDLTLLEAAVSVSHRAKHIIVQNLSWAIVYNLIALPLAVMGLVPPWLAAIGMSSSSLIVVLNALRLSR